MNHTITSEQLMIPVYINEKIVLDMLAIIEDGFSSVSQVNYTEHKESASEKKLSGGASTEVSLPFWSKLFKIDLQGDILHTGNKGTDENTTKEKVHTNVSLLSKFRGFLIKHELLNTEFNISKMKIGDFIEIEGELQKNPLIECLDIFNSVYNMANIFSKETTLGNKTKARQQKTEEQKIADQIKQFTDELKNSGTIDFVLSDNNGEVVLSAQEQYLANDNVSEIIGGRFKVLGKVISVCKDEGKSISLLRKTTLSILTEDMLNKMFSGFQNIDEEEKELFNLPELKTRITSPAIIVIPIAIYA